MVNIIRGLRESTNSKTYVPVYIQHCYAHQPECSIQYPTETGILGQARLIDFLFKKFLILHEGLFHTNFSINPPKISYLPEFFFSGVFSYSCGAVSYHRAGIHTCTSSVCVRFCSVSYPSPVSLIFLPIFLYVLCTSYHGMCCLLYTSPSPRDGLLSRMPSSA